MNVEGLYQLGQQLTLHHAKTVAMLNGPNHGIRYGTKSRIKHTDDTHKRVLVSLKSAIEGARTGADPTSVAFHIGHASQQMDKYATAIRNLADNAEESSRWDRNVSYPEDIWRPHHEESKQIARGIRDISKKATQKVTDKVWNLYNE